MEREVVNRDDVMKALKCGPGSQAVEYIFASGSDVLPVEVFRDVVGSLSLHPQPLSFASVFMQRAAFGCKRMLPLFPYMLLFVVVLFVVPFMVSTDHHSAYNNLWHWVNNDWGTGCFDGPESPVVCELLG